MHKGVTIQTSPVSPQQLIERTDDMETLNRLLFPAKDDIYDDFMPKQRDIEQMFVDYDSNAFNPIPESAYGIVKNPFIKMCFVGFSAHRPITLTPDLLWHYIRNAVAVHVNKNSEELRKVFVNHEGKMTLTVRRDDFVVGQDNDWPGVFQEFRQLVEENLNESAKPVISERFSTTTKTIHDISCISLMDVVQSYFSYKLYTLCGIPSVTLLGELNDWMKLKEAAENLLNMFQDMPNGTNLEWWRNGLVSVLEKLIQCYQNPGDHSLEDWMARIFKYNREFGSGAVNYITGWVNVFFPYIGAERNPFAHISSYPKLERHVETHNYEPNDTPALWKDEYIDNHFKKLEAGDFPLGLSQAPFTWEYYDQAMKMDLVGGPCCVTEQVLDEGSAAPIGSLHVNHGWAVTYRQESQSHSKPEPESDLCSQSPQKVPAHKSSCNLL